MSESRSDRDLEVLEALGANYRADGFQFVIDPSTRLAPPFLRPYRPDAMALKGKGGVLIELVRVSQDRNGKTRALSKLVEGHPDWRLEVVLADNFLRERGWVLEPDAIPSLPAGQLGTLREDVRRLIADRQASAAILLGWSLLEALTRSRVSQLVRPSARPLTGWQVVEQLTSFGLVEEGGYERLRRLLPIRNAIAHGDFQIGTVRDAEDLARIIDEVAQEEKAAA